MTDKVKIFSGSSNIPLAKSISEQLGLPLGEVTLSQFDNGELYVSYGEPIRTCHIFIVQSLSDPVNENFMELLIMIDAAKRASAKTINIIMPYYGYARQERKRHPREAISAKLVADLLHTAGASRIITLDLHTAAIQGFFTFPVDHLTALDELTEHIRAKNIENPVIVSPDAGRASTAEKLANYLQAPFAMVVTNHDPHTGEEKMHVIGDVKDKTPVIIEDIIDTGRTLFNVVEKLVEKGGRDVVIAATHGLFSGDALDKLNHPHIREIVVTDSILQQSTPNEKLTVIPTAGLFTEAIRSNIYGGSIATLFKNRGI
ncbi:ribose-phosphate diphosphokinase [Paenibacillus albicereus]|uniref:ribose-phosphate diphosphokinase n=1 Tax=Paenibacillus albicereus TaxID=2726185 RepID=A0A6H2GTQ2_9BACL|nr:ribose-phosphate diphosphokinase [Paenibacillus albicereus]QJC50739.1 ribose-phosphate diphosphokinase [Paenibacillus albicereus]